MINSVTVTNHVGESIKLELRSPEKSGFIVQDIRGLGPPKAEVSSTALVSGDGVTFNSARVGYRNIIFQLKYLKTENMTIEQCRQLSYKYFPIKKRVDLLIETDERICTTFGYIESNETTIFSKTTGSMISIICPNPYLVSKFVQTKVFTGLDSLFEFPFSNESLTEDLIILGNVKNKQEDNIPYDGDVDVGVIMSIKSIGEATNVSIYNVETREEMFIDTDRLITLTGNPIIAGDEIMISTVDGNKYIKLFRNGEIINILNCLSRDSAWPHLRKGQNVFAYSADTGIIYLEFKIENNVLYEGV